MTDRSRTIERDCLGCGKQMWITVYEDDTYDGGHYFGEFSAPAEGSEREYEKTGEWEGYDVVTWTGDQESIEYWECDDCVSSRQEN